jgi:pimeloyl-ACP methyl ester carboxylesterase
MADDVLVDFLKADLVGRLTMTLDDGKTAALTRYLGAAGYARLRALADEVALHGPEHLAPDSSSNLIFIPGVMGSLLKPKYLAGVWWIDARAHKYINSLALGPDGGVPSDLTLDVEPFQLDLGYIPFLMAAAKRKDFGCVTHPYDWRKPVGACTAGLRQAVEQAHTENGGQPVHLVAHSMGGLLVRATLAEHGSALWPKLGRIVFLGTPHYGSPAIAFYLKNHFWGTDLMALLGLVLSRETFRSLWGPLSMLPAPRGIYPGTRDSDNPRWASGDPNDAYVHPCANFDLYQADQWQLGLDAEAAARLQKVLDAAAEFHRRLEDAHVNKLTNEQRARMAVIIGVGQPTPFRLANKAGFFGLWPHMDKITRREEGNPLREGDGSVPQASATLDYVGATRYVHGVHRNLPNIPQVWEDAFRWLRSESLLLPQTPVGALRSHLGPGAVPKLARVPDFGAPVFATGLDGPWDPNPVLADRLKDLVLKLEADQLPEFNDIRIL